jgi:hypothetical protein
MAPGGAGARFACLVGGVLIVDADCSRRARHHLDDDRLQRSAAGYIRRGQARQHHPGSQTPPAALKVLWTIWLAAAAINLIVWVLVSATAGDLIYPWPMWVAGPSGAALLALSAGVTAIRRGRRSAAQHPPGQG